MRVVVTLFDFSREYDFPPAIMWDALVDPVLVSGWLGEAEIEPVTGGRYLVHWIGSPSTPGVDGLIHQIVPKRMLVVDTDTYGLITFDLEEHPGGTRGTWVRLLVDFETQVDRVFEERVADIWNECLGRLDELLRGRPTDWDGMNMGARVDTHAVDAHAAGTANDLDLG